MKNSEDISQVINSLDLRIRKIEKFLELDMHEEELELTPLNAEKKETEKEVNDLEFKIGQFWFAKVGIVLLAIGIIFLLTLPHKNLPPVLPSLMGYIIVIALFVLSYYWRNTFSFVSKYLFGGGLLLLYFATLRLHYFCTEPAIAGKSVEMLLLVLVVAANLFISARRKSAYLAVLSLILGYITAIISREPYFIFSLLTLLAVTSVYYKLKFKWDKLIPLAIILTYFTHFIWVINNPFWGNKIKIIQEPEINILFLLVYVFIFASSHFFRKKGTPESATLIVSTFLNTVGCYALYLFITLNTLEATLALSHFAASIIFITVSFVFWSRHRSKYSTFFYAILGYTALSVAIILQFHLPDFFIVLCWQSILVVSTAIWFRSKIIIVANFVIFLILFIAYLVLVGKASMTSLSFGIVALVSARILNWKKDKLELKTEMMRNAYLTTAFFIFPYALYHSVPEGYLVLSWIAITFIYYFLSNILKNKKYRWMAHLTLLLTVLYVTIIGTMQFEPVYRIISFLVVGIVLIIVSLVYTKLKSKMD